MCLSGYCLFSLTSFGLAAKILSAMIQNQKNLLTPSPHLKAISPTFYLFLHSDLLTMILIGNYQIILHSSFSHLTVIFDPELELEVGLVEFEAELEVELVVEYRGFVLHMRVVGENHKVVHIEVDHIGADYIEADHIEVGHIEVVHNFDKDFEAACKLVAVLDIGKDFALLEVASLVVE